MARRLRLEGPHIQASGYRRGRERKRWPENGITFLVYHTAEGARDEIELGHFFASLGTASSSCGIGQDGGYASYVRYRDTPWTNPPIHDDTETLEICGFAGWSRRTWLEHDKMLETIARWTAWRSAVNDIPIRRIEGDRLRNGFKGIVDHDGINDVFHESDHWNVGENFPWDIVLPRAREIRENKGVEDDMPTVAEVWNKMIGMKGDRLPARTRLRIASETSTRIEKAVHGMWKGLSIRQRATLNLVKSQQALIEEMAESGPEAAATWTNLRNRTRQIRGDLDLMEASLEDDLEQIKAMEEAAQAQLEAALEEETT